MSARGRGAGLALAALLLPSGRATALPDVEVVRRVTLQEAVAAADQVPELIAARAGERAAAAAVRVARAWPDPSVSFTTNSVNARESLAAALPLPWPGRGPRLEAARADLRASAHARESARASARRELRVAWFELAAAEQRAQAAADRAARARTNAEALAALFEQGRIARLDRLRGEAEAALARAERASADEARRTAVAALGALLGLDPGGALATDGAHPSPGPEESLEACLARARDDAPEVRVQRAQAQAAEARLELARRLRLPGLGLAAGAEWNDPTQPGTNRWIGLNLSFPLAGAAAEAAALAERDRQRALLERERRTAATAAESAWHAARAARMRFEAIESDLLPAARQTAELARLAQREGKADVFRLLDAERLLSEAELAGADAYEAWGVAHADLLRATAEDER